MGGLYLIVSICIVFGSLHVEMLFVNLSLRTYTSLSTHGEALVLLARNLTLFLIYLIHFLSIRQAKLSRTLLLLGGNGL